MAVSRLPQAAVLLLLAAASAAAVKPDGTPRMSKGPSTKVSPYLVPLQQGVFIHSLLTAGDSVPLTSNKQESYKLVGVPDGMGAYLTANTPDLEYNKNCRPKLGNDYSEGASSTFTLLLNHELGKDRGGVRRHGATGAFVSEYIIDRNTLKVISGEDLTEKVATWNNVTNTYNAPASGPAYAFDRFCSADLPAISAYYDAASKTGTKDRIFMNGEETLNGRAFAHVATGAEKGISYELPRLGKGGWENQVACPHSGAQTVVIGLDDNTDGQVYVYIGQKQNTGNAIDKAGLTNGNLYGIRVIDFPISATDSKSREPNTTQPMKATVGKYGPFRFELKLIGNGDVRNLPEIETASDVAGATRWYRPEDGFWHPLPGSDGSATFFFATTASFSLRSRVWKVVFEDIKNPLKGGSVTAVVEGSELQVAGTPKMVDNLVANCDDSVYLQEDPGGQDYLGRIWRYHPEDGLIPLAQHNPRFFQPNFTGSDPPKLTRDEESSGIISADGMIINRPGDCFIVNTQAHYPIEGEIVEGAQLMLMCVRPFVPKRAPKQPAIAS
jgi:hypothetical protein